MEQKFCLDCGSEDVSFEAGGVGGAMVCKECGYVGLFPEKEVIKEENEIVINKKENKLKNTKSIKRKKKK